MHRRGVGDLLLTVRGVPGLPNTLKRVPELPNAHEGISMRLALEERGDLG